MLAVDPTRPKPKAKLFGGLGPTLTAAANSAPVAKAAAAIETVTGWRPSNATQCVPPTVEIGDPLASGKYDGHLVGVGGRIGEVSNEGVTVSPVLPRSARVQNESSPTLFVNGVLNTMGDQLTAMQGLADSLTQGIVGMHNATAGGFKDVLEALGQRLNLHTPRVVDAVSKHVLDQLRWKSEAPISLVAHSQGALVVSQALDKVIATLKKSGVPSLEIEQRLSRIEVTTFGGVAATYPDGPKYTHLINDADPLPGSATALGFSPGKGAKVLHFKDAAKETGDETFGPHLLATYLKAYDKLKVNLKDKATS